MESHLHCTLLCSQIPSQMQIQRDCTRAITTSLITKFQVWFHLRNCCEIEAKAISLSTPPSELPNYDDACSCSLFATKYASYFCAQNKQILCIESAARRSFSPLSMMQPSHRSRKTHCKLSPAGVARQKFRHACVCV